MAERNIDDLEGLQEAGTAPPHAAPSAAAVEAPPAPAAPVRAPLVELNYPDPTALAIIVRDVSRWSGHAFVMEPSVNARLQIFAPRRMPPQEAYELFLASLSVVGLRAVQVGKIVKIVPVTIAVSA